MHPNLKIDTHRDNIPMQKVLKRNGFSECGIIYIENGDERIAFQKI
jgi:RimJ/RimL family protein N-acetyltransferase